MSGTSFQEKWAGAREQLRDALEDHLTNLAGEGVVFEANEKFIFEGEVFSVFLEKRVGKTAEYLLKYGLQERLTVKIKVKRTRARRDSAPLPEDAE